MYDNKEYWKKVGGNYLDHYPKDAYREIDKAFVNTIKRELDLNKIEKVLEIGCGFGRVSKIMLNILSNVRDYYAMDLSDEMIEQSKEYCGDALHERFFPIVADFEECFDDEFRAILVNPTSQLFDLVLSIEVMTSIPAGIQGEYRVKKFIDKMISMSKKYVVNQDWFNAPNRIESMRKPMRPLNEINQFHDYDLHYSNNRKVLQVIGHSIPHYSEHIFVVRVR